MPVRRSYKCTVTTVVKVSDDTVMIRVSADDLDTTRFLHVGSFVFVRTKEDVYYDTPISVLYSSPKDKTLGFVVIGKGIKTVNFCNIKIGDTVWLRGPYYNGIFNKRFVENINDSQAILLTRGIAVLPSLHVVASLGKNKNRYKLMIDHGTFNQVIIDKFCEEFKQEVTMCSISDSKGELTDEIKQLLREMTPESCKLLHLGLSDYLIRKVVRYILDNNDYHPELSACNNAKMCCGEGICGACTDNVSAHDVLHLCKAQINLYEYFGK